MPNILFETIFGSKLYDTQTADSDTDYKAVYAPSLEDLTLGKVDVYSVWTDNETWCGITKPHTALQRYREKMGIDAKLVVCGCTATEFTIADPMDPGMLDIVGFDSAVSQLIDEFSIGAI